MASITAADRTVELRAVLGCARATGYVAVRALRRRVANSSPWTWLGYAVAAVLVGVAQALVATAGIPGGEPGADVVERVLSLAPLWLPLLLLATANASPFRFTVAEVSWLLTAPGGGRVLVARHLLARPVRYAALALTGGAAARWWMGQSPALALRLAATGAIIALTTGLVSTGRHLLTVRWKDRRGVHTAVGIAAALWFTVMVVSFWVPELGWVRLQPVTHQLALTVTGPSNVSPRWLLAAVGLLLAATALSVWRAAGFEEPADQAARQSAQMLATLRESHSVQDLAAASYRQGLRSLHGHRAFRGEAALAFRSLAQERRRLVQTLTLPASMIAVTIALVVLAPGLAWLPLPVALLNLISASTTDGLAVELDHQHLQLADLRPLPVLLWVSAVPAMRTTAVLEALWLPHAFTPTVSLDAWASGAILLPAGAAVLVSAGNLATVLGRSMLGRHVLATVLAGAATAPATLLVLAPDQRGVVELAAASAVLLAGAAGWLGLASAALTRAYLVPPRVSDVDPGGQAQAARRQ